MDAKLSQPKIEVPVIQKYFTLGAVEGLLCLVLLLILPADPDSRWLLGLSIQRVVLIAIALGANLLAWWLLFKSSRDEKWTRRFIDRSSFYLQKEKIVTFLTTLLLILCLLGVWFLISTYFRSDYRIRPQLLETTETIQAYMLRIAPFVLWGTAISIQTLYFMHLSGYATRERFHRVVRRISFFSVPVLMVILFMVNKIDHKYYKFITDEDRLLEVLTVYCLLLAGFFSLLLALRIKDRSNRRFWFFLVFTVLSVLFALEEMSWGQRIFDVKSPEFFMEHSDQQEINVHNVLQEWFSFRTKHVAALVLFAYGTCLPLLGLNNKVSDFVGRLGVPIPPLALSLGFTISAVLMIDVFSGKEEEVGEFCFSLCLFLFMLLEFLFSSGKVVDEASPLQANSH